MERAHIDTGEGNVSAVLSVVFAVLGLLAVPAGVIVAQQSQQVTLRWGIAGGGLLAIAFSLVALLLARRGRLRAQRNISHSGAGASKAGRIVGTFALCAGIAAAIALVTDKLLTHFQH
jgi:hypothetical protein